MTNLRNELTLKVGNIASFRNDQFHELERKKEIQNLDDLSPRSDFEEKLTALKECIADVLEEKLSLEQNDFQQIMINKATQTDDEREEGRHIISINNDDEEEALKCIDKNVLLLKQEIDNFDNNHADRNCSTSSGQIWRSKSSSEVWNLRAELAFLKKQIKDEEMDRKNLQNHIQMLQATIQENEEILDLIKEKEKNAKANDNRDLDKNLNPFVEQIEKLKMELENVREYGEQYKRKVEERDLDIASLKKDIENLTNDIISSRARLDENSRLEERNRLIEFENKNLRDECSSLKAKLTKLKNQLVEVENETITKHADEVKNLSQQLDKARQACELSGAEMDRLREQSENLSKEVNHLRNFLNIANTEKEQLKTEAAEQLKEMEQLLR
ncbi:unnamed protein product [Onchocerca flexuosa]|uniref:GRIP domain-containing protein n=1 Tax=Onchocerca flexuosa TaxID=387005 RepID=A0A183HS24_9BILA|nr:unnamed protein product [Onchocerca flexuosa]